MDPSSSTGSIAPERHASHPSFGVPPPPPPPEKKLPSVRPSPRTADAQEQDVILVAVRCRPLSVQEVAEGNENITRVLGQKLVIILDPGCAADDYLRLNKSREKRYCFDHAFGPDVSTRTVYEHTAKTIVPGVLHGYNATVFAYGATGAGKTFTMIGTPEMPGIMTMTLNSLFDEVAALRKESSNDSKFSIKCSFAEVYNEQIRDLLKTPQTQGGDGDKREWLELREDPVNGVCIVGITEVGGIKNSQEIRKLLHRGNQNRSTEPTAANVTSSRSHAVLQVCIEHQTKVDNEFGQETCLGKLSLIDLAGSERASMNDNKGARLLEGANINRSLLALGNCINALAVLDGARKGGEKDGAVSNNTKFVPYRDSKLTRFLKDSLGGNCRTVMIANISPNNLNYDDTLNTLKYASRAKTIKMGAYKNSVHADSHLEQYAQIIEELRTEVGSLKQELQMKNKHNGGTIHGVTSSTQDLLNREGGAESEVEEEKVCERWKNEVIQNLENRAQLQHQLIEITFLLAPQPLNDRATTQVNTTALTKRKLHLEYLLGENKKASLSLQSSLPKRVMNQDLRAFLDLVLRTCMVEVERMELDHIQATRQQALETKDQEIHNLRWQLHVRNQFIAQQREFLTMEQQSNLPDHVSFLESTITSPSQWMRKRPKPDPNGVLSAGSGDENMEGNNNNQSTNSINSVPNSVQSKNSGNAGTIIIPLPHPTTNMQEKSHINSVPNSVQSTGTIIPLNPTTTSNQEKSTIHDTVEKNNNNNNNKNNNTNTNNESSKSVINNNNYNTNSIYNNKSNRNKNYYNKNYKGYKNRSKNYVERKQGDRKQSTQGGYGGDVNNSNTTTTTNNNVSERGNQPQNMNASKNNNINVSSSEQISINPPPSLPVFGDELTNNICRNTSLMSALNENGSVCNAALGEHATTHNIGNRTPNAALEPFRATYWKDLEVPDATKIKGLAKIVEPINFEPRPRSDLIGWAAPPLLDSASVSPSKRLSRGSPKGGPLLGGASRSIDLVDKQRMGNAMQHNYGNARHARGSVGSSAGVVGSMGRNVINNNHPHAYVGASASALHNGAGQVQQHWRGGGPHGANEDAYGVPQAPPQNTRSRSLTRLKSGGQGSSSHGSRALHGPGPSSAGSINAVNRRQERWCDMRLRSYTRRPPAAGAGEVRLREAGKSQVMRKNQHPQAVWSPKYNGEPI